MALLSRAILLICIAGYVHGQYPSEENIPQRIGTTPKPKYQRLQIARPGGPQIQSIIGGNRPRRPVPLSRPRPIPTADGPEYPSFTSARPRPIYASPLAGKELHVPTAAQERQHVKQEQQQQQQQQQHQQQQKQQQQQQQQEQSVIKPVSEETEEDEEDVDHAIANLGPIASFPQQSGNLVAGPLTPKPDLGLIQYRGGSPAGSARPAPLNEQNIAPVQYRPPKPLKHRKTIIEDVPEIRIPVRQQQQQQQHQQQQQQQQQQQPQHHQQQQRQQVQAPVRTVQKIPDHRDKYSEPHDKHAESRDKYSELRDKYSGSRGKKPVAQIIRRWREDNPDGSITWGFENDDGSYKEELIGVDCITRGKYGYVDLDGLRREYSYETGIKCDEEQQEEDRENGFVDYTENKLVLPNGKTIDLSNMGKKQARRPQPIYRN